MKIIREFQRKNIKNDLISISPHNLRLFEYFIIQRKKKYNFITSDELYLNKKTNKRILIRHDIDYFPEKIKSMVNLELKYKIKSDIHVMVDEVNYDIKKYVKFLKSLSENGFLIALHSNVMSYDNKINQFESEIIKFNELIGFYPKTFSLHGKIIKYKNYIDIKNDFLNKCRPVMKKYNVLGSHNICGIDHWIEDSLRGGEFSYLTEDFFSKNLPNNKVLGVLLHPDHWVKNKIHEKHLAEISKVTKNRLIHNEHIFLEKILKND
tara:strand:- start:88 stop:882 length:795 start_codon:yes stop_codon:yes gene_type:complete